MNWTALNNSIAENSSFLLSTHVNPDGDSICTTLSLYWYLKSIGKDVHMYNHDPVPLKFSFLVNSEKISTVHPTRKFDVFVILDASNPSRLGWEGHCDMAHTIINIDHHRDNSYCGDVNIVDATSAAASMLIYELFENNKVIYPDYIAETLYAGILTDTGGFHFSNTTSNVLSICAELAKNGANCSRIYKKIYASYSTKGLLLRARIWSTLTYYFDERVCSMTMPISLLDKTGANYGDIEGMSDMALTAKGVEVGIFVKNYPEKTQFSLRSTGSVDVGHIAQEIIGGGGHTCAAGCTIEEPVETALPKLLKLISQEL